MNLGSITRRIHQHTARAARAIGAALLFLLAMVEIATADVSLDLALGRERTYPGETVPVTVTLRISDATVRNIGYPRLATPAGGTVEFSPPEHDSDVSEPGITLQKFKGQISGVEPGQLVVGPASLDCEIMESARGSEAFFGAVEPRHRSLVTTPAVLSILPLPAVGRPTSFSGAVGIFNMNVTIKPDTVSIGDPLTIITTIRGSGSLINVNCPDVKGPDLRQYPVWVSHPAGALVCEQLIVPNATGLLPPVFWSYFDPQQHSYRTLRGDLPVVGPAVRNAAATPAAVATTEALPSATPSSPYGTYPLIWVIAILTLAAALFSVRALRRRRHVDSSPMQPIPSPPHLTQLLTVTEQALIDEDVEKFYTWLFAVIQELIACHNCVPALCASSFPVPKYPSDASEIDLLIANCDRVRYGRIPLSRRQMHDDFRLLQAIIGNIHSSAI